MPRKDEIPGAAVPIPWSEARKAMLEAVGRYEEGTERPWTMPRSFGKPPEPISACTAESLEIAEGLDYR